MYIVAEQQKRGQLVAQMRAIQEKADKEGRAMTAEEAVEFDRIDTEQEKAGKAIAEHQARAARMKTATDAITATTDSGRRPVAGEGEGTTVVAAGADDPVTAMRASKAYEGVFRAYLANGVNGVQQIVAAGRANELQMDLLTKGGALVGPQQFVADLIKAIDDAVFVRQFATKYQVTNAESLGAPTLDADPADADWTTELSTGNQGTMDFGKRELRPHPAAKRVKVSKKLARASSIGIDSLVRERVAYKCGITREKAYLLGTGSQQPLGVFTASNDGIPTSRDVSTGNTTTAPTADGLIECKHSVKSGYWPLLRWAFHRTALKLIRKEKDLNGQYVWQPGLSADLPDRILEIPYDVSEYVPNTFTTGLYVGILAAWRYYWIVDALDVTVERLVELYAEANQDGYIARMEGDGMPVLAEAFARVKLA